VKPKPVKPDRTKAMLAEVRRNLAMLNRVGLYAEAQNRKPLLENLQRIAHGQKPIHY
jgi:hypothetical protein